MNLAACLNRIRRPCLCLSITRPRSEARPPRNYATPPRTNPIQIQQLAQVTRFGAREARAAKLEPRAKPPDPRLEVRGPRTYLLGPRPSGLGSGFRQDIKTSIYNRLSVTPARAEHYAFPKSGNERGNNSEHKKAVPTLRRLYI